MKNLWICILLIVSLAACAGAASDKGSCSKNNEVCIKVHAEEPILFGKPINIVITITSEEDFPSLGISLITWPNTLIVGKAQGVEQGTEIWQGQSGVDWIIKIKAGEIVTLTRKVYLPSEDGKFDIIVHASTPQLRAIDQLSIYQTNKNVNIYLSGTKVPISESPLPTMNPSMLETLRARPTETPYPTLTPYPTSTSTPTSWAYPPPTSPPWDAPGEEPYP